MKQTKPAEINARIDKILKDRAESLQEIGDTLTRTFEEMKAATREAETAQSAGDVELYTEIQLKIEKLSMAAKVRKNQYAALSQSPLVTGDESRAVADELIAYERENDRCYLKAVAKAVTMLANAQREYEDNLQAAKDALIRWNGSVGSIEGTMGDGTPYSRELVLPTYYEHYAPFFALVREFLTDIDIRAMIQGEKRWKTDAEIIGEIVGSV